MNLSRRLTCLGVPSVSSRWRAADQTIARLRPAPPQRGDHSRHDRRGVPLRCRDCRRAVAEAKRIPEFPSPGPAFDASSVAGKTIFNIPVSSANAFVTQVGVGARDAADKAGVKWIEFANQGSPTEWSQGMELAISRKVDLILLTAVDPSRIVTQIRAAEKAGIPVVNVHAVVEGQEPKSAPVTAWTYGPFLDAARLEADWVIADSGGDAEVLLITTDEFPPSKPQRQVMEQEFAKLCPDCKVSVTNVASAEWASKLVTETQSYLTGHPNAGYIIPFYDSMAPFVESGIKSAGKTGKVKVATYNGRRRYSN